MNKTIVTFKDDNRIITMNFVHNLETGELDYNVTMEPQLEEGESLDLVTILADKFISSLLPDESDIEVVPEEFDSNI